jgi:hypothetical protein
MLGRSNEDDQVWYPAPVAGTAAAPAGPPRSVTAQELVVKIARTNSASQRFAIIDARPRENAYGNKAKGAGYEDVSKCDRRTAWGGRALLPEMGRAFRGVWARAVMHGPRHDDCELRWAHCWGLPTIRLSHNIRLRL